MICAPIDELGAVEKVVSDWYSRSGRTFDDDTDQIRLYLSVCDAVYKICSATSGSSDVAL